MSFRDKLLQAGLISEEQAKKAAREERGQKKAKGHKGAQAERQARSAQTEAQLAQRREADRARELARRSEAEQKEAEHRAAQIAASGQVKHLGRPSRRWYFVARDGRVPYLEVNEDAAGQLERGTAALVEPATGDPLVVAAEAAERLEPLVAGWIRAWNR